MESFALELAFSSTRVFCLGKFRQIHESKAVESPRAETEPVVLFPRSPLSLLPLTGYSVGLVDSDKTVGRGGWTQSIRETHTNSRTQNLSAGFQNG